MFKLKEIRKERKMTQHVLAQTIGVTESAVAQWETGRRKPDYNTLLHIAAALECTVEDIIGTPEEVQAELTPPVEYYPRTHGDKILFNALRDASEEDKIRAAKILEALRS